MPFWTYMLHCADRTFYVGHTNDLTKRMWQHEQGFVLGYTENRRPVALVWSAEFEQRDEARAVEEQLKGWGKPEKLALIRGDWTAISQLASKKERASTSSASPGWRKEEFLQPHLDAAPRSPFWLRTRLHSANNRFLLGFKLAGDVSSVVIPPPGNAQRRDELWRSTCYECFLQLEGGGYVEVNVSPSCDWAAYRFEHYREGMHCLEIMTPTVRSLVTARSLELSARFVLPSNLTPTRIGLSAVIEEKSGRKSYWALRHPRGPPDFHHPDCFALELPPPA